MENDFSEDVINYFNKIQLPKNKGNLRCREIDKGGRRVMTEKTYNSYRFFYAFI